MTKAAIKQGQDHFAALMAMMAEDFTGEQEGDKEEVEQDQEEKEDVHAQVVSSQVKPLRSGMTKKIKTKTSYILVA